MRFSVVITPADSGDGLRDTLHALRRQTYAAFEVIVVNGPTDPGPEAFGRAVRRVESGPGARDAGTAAAAGDVVTLLAAGSLPDPRWLADLAAAYADPTVGGAGGVVYDPADDRATHRVAVRDRETGTRREATPPFTPFQLPGADPHVILHPSNASFRRDALLAAGGFGGDADPARGTDDACRRLIDRGHRVVPLDGAAVYARAGPVAPGPAAVSRSAAAIPPPDARAFRPFPVLVPAEKRLTLCFVSREYPPGPVGGVGRLTAELAHGLADAGHEVHVVTEGERPAVEFDGGVWVRRVPAEADGDWNRPDLPPTTRAALGWAAAAHAAVKRLAAGRVVDLVSAPVENAEGLFCRLDDDLKTVLSLHATARALAAADPARWGDPGVADLIALERLALRGACPLTAPGRAARDRARRDYDAPAARVLPLGFADPSRPPARRRADGRIRVLASGRLGRRNGTDLFLAAAAALAPEFPDAEFILIGDDPPAAGGGTYRREFEQRFGGEPWAGRVAFHRPASGSALAAEYDRCDVVVLPCREEPTGLAAVEAMAFGKPVVAAGIGGLPDVVADGETGYLAYPDSAASLVAHLRPLLADAGLRARLGAAGRRRFEALFRRDEAVPAAVRAFTELAEAFAA